MITDDEMKTKKKPRFIPFKCPNCNGYGSVSYGKRICNVCNGKGAIIVDQKTGLQVDDDDETKELHQNRQ